MKNKVNILGTVYKIYRGDYEHDKYINMDQCFGYCNMDDKEIVICKLETHPNYTYVTDTFVAKHEKETLRHEIVHAFLKESGLDGSSLQYEGAWPRNEEMIDWIAIQGEKIYKAWKEAEAL